MIVVDRLAEIEARIGIVSDRQEYGEHLAYVLQRDIERLNGCVSEKSNNSDVSCLTHELNLLRNEISEIKTAIMDVHDMLRSMGMDDMSRRLGDLNLFLT